MKIESVDFFYLSMPVIRNVGDGSQDALLVRLCAGGLCLDGGSAKRRRWFRSPVGHAPCRTVSVIRSARQC